LKGFSVSLFVKKLFSVQGHIWAYVSFVSIDTLCRANSYGSVGQFENPCRAISKRLTIMVRKKLGKNEASPSSKSKMVLFSSYFDALKNHWQTCFKIVALFQFLLNSLFSLTIISVN
jgi:hypothetical protein